MERTLKWTRTVGIYSHPHRLAVRRRFGVRPVTRRVPEAADPVDVSTTVGAGETELFQSPLELRLGLQEFKPEHLGRDRDVVIGGETGLHRLVDEVVRLRSLLDWVAEASGLTGASVELSPDILDTVLPPRFNGYDVNYSITNETQVAENNDYVWIIETTSATTFTVNWRAVAYFHNGQSVTDPFDLSVRPGTTLEVDVI
jgi:hypothetical protein